MSEAMVWQGIGVDRYDNITFLYLIYMIKHIFCFLHFKHIYCKVGIIFVTAARTHCGGGEGTVVGAGNFVVQKGPPRITIDSNNNTDGEHLKLWSNNKDGKTCINRGNGRKLQNKHEIVLKNNNNSSSIKIKENEYVFLYSHNNIPNEIYRGWQH